MMAAITTPTSPLRTTDRFLNIVEHVLSDGSNAREEISIQHIENIDESKETDSEEIPLADVNPPRRSLLNQLSSEAANLKAKDELNQIPPEKLVKLLQELEVIVRNSLQVDQTDLEDDDQKENKRNQSEVLAEESNLGAFACLAALHIFTGKDMPKVVYLEDLIEVIAQFTKYHLQSTIFPAYDPVYRNDPKSKDRFSSSKKKRAIAGAVKDTIVIGFYMKLCEIIELLTELVQIHTLTDSIVLQFGTIGVSPFFVENVPELQLVSLKLLTALFTKYERHRRLILEDILASLSRLPNSKKGLRKFKLSADINDRIQMFTALILQLIQSITFQQTSHLDMSASRKEVEKTLSLLETQLLLDFDTSTGVVGKFSSDFLSKCGTKSEDAECDFRILFEHFLQDLVTVVHRPAWPAAEVTLSMLSILLARCACDKTMDILIRGACLENLGIVAASLRRGAAVSNSKNIVSEIIQRASGKTTHQAEATDQENVAMLQWLLLEHLDSNGRERSDSSLVHAKHFYVGYWLKSFPTTSPAPKIVAQNSSSKPCPKSKKRKRQRSESKSEEDQDETHSRLVESEKNSLIKWIVPLRTPMDSNNNRNLDDNSAQLIAQFLSNVCNTRAAKGFDYCLSMILNMSMDPMVQLRSKALHCLTTIIEADPGILSRNDMQLWVRNSFLDQSPHVREAAVDLVGKHVLACPELIGKYHEMLSARILDTGVGVRKRVIRTLRDICVKCPDFAKVPELCVKMVKRIIDEEETVRKLVRDVFQTMWFSTDGELLDHKVAHITGVVEEASSEKVAMDCLRQLLRELFHSKEDEETATTKGKGKKNEPERQQNRFQPPKSLLAASSQIVRLIIDKVLTAEEDGETTQLSLCISTLLLFAKTWPPLLVQHASMLQEYLTWKCHDSVEAHAVTQVAGILTLVVPLMTNPSDPLLAQIEENCVKLVFRNDKNLVEASTVCLAAVVNRMTKNYELVRDVFQKYQNAITTYVQLLKKNPKDPKLAESRPLLRRSVFTIGLFLRYFDFTCPSVCHPLSEALPETIFNDLLFLLEAQSEPQPGPSTATNSKNPSLAIQQFSLRAIGHMSVRNPELLLHDELKRIYKKFLSSSIDIESPLTIQTLVNIHLYLAQESGGDFDYDDFTPVDHNIKILDDVAAGMNSTIAQIYLADILGAYLHPEVGVRLESSHVLRLIVEQGLVNPVQIVPTLIAMSTDNAQGITGVADRLLQEIHAQHPQFLQSQVLHGFRLSIQLQQRITSRRLVRGFRPADGTKTVALNGSTYYLLRGSKPARRAIVMLLLKQFEDQQEPKEGSPQQLLYYADNLATFPYATLDEPMFIIHHLDIAASVNGSNVLEKFNECLLPAGGNDNDERQKSEEDEEDVESLLARFPQAEDASESTKSRLQSIREFSDGHQSCLLLLMLKKYLKECYGITDTRVAAYSPQDTSKIYEKPVNRKPRPAFEPLKCTLTAFELESVIEWKDTLEERRTLVEQYLQFKDLMLQVDRGEDGQVGILTLNQEDDEAPLEILKQSKKSKPAKRKHPAAKESKSKPKSRRKRKKAKLTTSSTSESESSDEHSSDPDYE